MAFFRNIKTLQSFHNSAFRYYFAGMSGQWAASSMQVIVQSLLVYRLTGSALILGVMSLATAVPQMIFTLYAGVLVDRFSKKNLIQVSQILWMVMAIIIAVSLRSGYLSKEHPGSWWVLIATSVMQGIFFAIMNVVRQAIIPELVGKELVLNAVSLANMGMNIFQVAAPALGGFLIDLIGFEYVYFIMAGLCLVGIIFTAFMPSMSGVAGRGKNALHDVMAGLKYTWQRPVTLLIVIFTLICIIVAMPLNTMISIFSDSILKVGATGLGLLQSSAAVGMLITSGFLASMPSKRRGMMMLAGGLILGIAQAVFAFSRSMPLSMAANAFVGVGKIAHLLLAISLIQSYTEASYMGRVMSILMLNMGIGSLGTFFSGILASRIGIQESIGGFAIALIVISILAMVLFPKVRKLD